MEPDTYPDWRTLPHRRPLRTLAEKVHPGHTSLLVIDVVNDFCAPAGMLAQGGANLEAVHRMLPHLERLLNAGRANGILTIFAPSAFTSPQNWFLSDAWLEVASRRGDGRGFTHLECCSPGSWGAEFHGRIKPLPTELVITKHRYNAFHGTDLDLVLRAQGVRTVITAGVSTNVCVETTARDAFTRDYYVVLPSDGTAAYAEASHEATLRNIDTHFGQVAQIDEIIGAWDDQSGVPDVVGSE